MLPKNKKGTAAHQNGPNGEPSVTVASNAAAGQCQQLETAPEWDVLSRPNIEIFHATRIPAAEEDGAVLLLNLDLENNKSFCMSN